MGSNERIKYKNEESRRHTTIPISKKGDKNDPDNYPGIKLLTTSLKLLTSILFDEIYSQIPISEEHRFRKDRSTVEALFVIRQLVGKSLKFNTPAYLYFIDLTNAFNTVKDVIKIHTQTPKDCKIDKRCTQATKPK